MQGKFVGGEFVYVSEIKAKHLSANCAQSSDLIFTQRGTLGQVSIIPEGTYDRYLVSQSQMKLSVNTSKYDPAYFYYYFSSPVGQRQIVDSAIQTGVPHTNLGILKAYRIPVPKLKSEQQAIAEALGDTDELIAALEALIVKKRDVKRGAMQELLTGQRRLPGYGGEMQSSTLGPCLLRLPFYGINAAAVPYTDGLPRYLRITDITEDGRLSEKSPASVQHPDALNYLLTEGDIVLARTGASVGKSLLYSTEQGPLVFAGFLICIRPDQERISPGFLAAVLRTDNYWQWVASVSMRSGQPGINGPQYASLPLKLPNINEQRAIAAVLSDMDAEIAALEGKLAKVRAVKEGMMQMLLTGEVRLV
jgi:type I restriction enzyme, S subunit